MKEKWRLTKVHLCRGECVQGETPLHVACRHNLVSLTRSLLEAGANANVQTTSSTGDGRGAMKQTPLHVAVEAGHKDIVRVFLDFKGCVHVLSVRRHFTTDYNTL